MLCGVVARGVRETEHCNGGIPRCLVANLTAGFAHVVEQGRTWIRQLVTRYGAHRRRWVGNGVGTNFGVGVGEARPLPRERGWSSWRVDSQPLPTRFAGALYMLPQRGPGQSPGRRRVFFVF